MFRGWEPFISMKTKKGIRIPFELAKSELTGSVVAVVVQQIHYAISHNLIFVMHDNDSSFVVFDPVNMAMTQNKNTIKYHDADDFQDAVKLAFLCHKYIYIEKPQLPETEGNKLLL